ncbi:MAG: hypothetical protein J6X50_03840 [Bacilli bacterium]|nr:hypothetical protein [Bacilli bacterium]
MEKASNVMYSIANFFTWIVVICSIAGIVLSSLMLAGILQSIPEIPFIGTGSIVYFAIVLVVSLITIAMVRRAKAAGTSKAWDLLFMILGILGANIFYILGGLFGLLARR